MIRIRKIAFILFWSLLVTALFSQTIALDESYDDWSASDLLLDDVGDPFLGFDIEQLYVANDQEHLFIRLDFNQEVQLQDGSNVAIRIDLDNDPTTGFIINGIGADLTFFLGDRSGFLNTNTSSFNIDHPDIGLVVSPTVSSDRFEIAIRRNNTLSGINFDMQDQISIRIEHNGNIGDQLPNNDSGLSYSMDNSVISDLYSSSLLRTQDTEYRLMSFNVKRDQLFDSQRFDAFRNIFRTIDPDIIALQEVFDNNGTDTRQLVANMLGDATGDWFVEKRGFGTVLLSKYPIIFDNSIDGNSAYVIELDDQEIMIINAHLPCCDQDAQRRNEIDAILAYARDIRNGTGAYDLSADSPIIFCGDMNLVGLRDQLDNILSGNIINNNQFGPDLSEPIFSDLKPLTSGLPMSFTWFNSFSSFFPGRLDYIFYTADQLRVENSFSLNTPSLSQDQLSDFQIESGDSRLASDHSPVVLDFRFPNIVNNSNVIADNNPYKLYPIPTETTLYIEDDQPLNELALYDMTGRMISSRTVNANKTNIDLSTLEKGVYLLTRTLENETYLHKKIIVK